MSNFKHIASYGCLEIVERGHSVFVSYTGQMSSRIETVRELFEEIYGKGSWDEMMSVGEFCKDSAGNFYSDPTYLWCRRVPAKTFHKKLTKIEG